MNKDKTSRPAAVAGQFYPENPNELRSFVEGKMTVASSCAESVCGAIVPHAGVVYSGAVAGATYSQITPRENIILIGPDHYKRGRHPFVIDVDREWLTPLGAVPINTPLANLLRDEIDILYEEPEAFASEHSLEVQLPFLQVMNAQISFVPILINSDRIDELIRLGEEMARTLKKHDSGRKTLFIASTDMTHYESVESAKTKDAMALEAIKQLDPGGLFDIVLSQRISMCGWAPVCVMLSALNKMGPCKAALVSYDTSGTSTGDYDSVVGYAGMILTDG